MSFLQGCGVAWCLCSLWEWLSPNFHPLLDSWIRTLPTNIKLVKQERIRSINRQYLKKNALPYWHVPLQLSTRSDQNNSRLNSIQTPWNRVLLQNLTVLQLVRKFPRFCTTCKFITVFTRAHHFCASWVSCINPFHLHHIPVHFSALLWVLCAPPISSFWIWWVQIIRLFSMSF
jgi:hypothetical protein